MAGGGERAGKKINAACSTVCSTEEHGACESIFGPFLARNQLAMGNFVTNGGINAGSEELM